MESIFKSDYPADIREVFRDFIIEKGIKQTVIAKKMNLTKGHLNNILTLKTALTEENKKSLNEILGTTF